MHVTQLMMYVKVNLNFQKICLNIINLNFSPKLNLINDEFGTVSLCIDIC